MLDIRDTVVVALIVGVELWLVICALGGGCPP